MASVYLSIFGAVALSVIYSVCIVFWLNKKPNGNEKMMEIFKSIQIGSKIYLNRQYKTTAIAAIAIAIAVYFGLGLISAIGFLIGALVSTLAGYIGMNIAVKFNSKTAEAAKSGLKPALSLAFNTGTVTGFLVVALGLLTVALFFFITKNAEALISLGFGASLISIFARLGGGIFAKSADVGADSVGKIETVISENDIRNPGIIAANVGDNVGDCAGMATDLFETYAVTLIASMILGAITPGGSANNIIFPLILGSLAIIASLAGTLFVKISKKGTIMGALYKGLIIAMVFSAVLFLPAAQTYFGANYLPVYISALIGLVATGLIMIITDYYTAKKFRPVKSIAEASKSGYGANIIMGLSVGMEATALPIIIVVAAILSAYTIAGLYGIAIAATAMLSIAGMIAAIDSFGPIADNAGAIAEMSGSPKETRQITDVLDAVGNTAKAISKSYAIASAGLAALVLFGSYADELIKLSKNITFEIQNPGVLAGLLLGAAIPYLFSSITMKAVGKTAGAVIEEIRRQFKEIPGIMEYQTKPDYGKTVDIVTKAALKEMILPAFIPIVSVLLVGFFLGSQVLGGFLIGAIISGIFLALSMTSGGAAWDNAKKYIEDGNFGGQGSEAHKAAVTGDTVGDPYKDTAGPAINPLIKVMNILALLIVGFIK